MPVFIYRLLMIFSIVLLAAAGRYLAPESFHLQGSDEYYYLHYAQHVANNGVQGVRDLVDWYAQSAQNRYHPSPARLVYLFLTAFLVKIFGSSYSVLVSLSYLSVIIFCSLSFYYARKLFSKEVGAVFLVLLSSSPLTLGMGCVALSESFLNLLWGCSVWAFMDYIDKRSVPKMALVIAFLTLSVLVKESSILLFFFVIVFMTAARYFKVPVVIKDLALLCGIPAVLVFFIYLLVLGGPQKVLVLMHATYMTHFVDQANTYALNFSGGPWFRYFVDFLLLSPVMTLAAVGYMGHLILKHSRNWKEVYFLIYFAVIFIPLSFLQHTKVVRFVINLEMVLALLTSWAVLEFFKADIRNDRWLKPALSALLIAGISFRSFFKLFAVASMLDPITYHLMQIQGFIP